MWLFVLFLFYLVKCMFIQYVPQGWLRGNREVINLPIHKRISFHFLYGVWSVPHPLWRPVVWLCTVRVNVVTETEREGVENFRRELPPFCYLCDSNWNRVRRCKNLLDSFGPYIENLNTRFFLTWLILFGAYFVENEKKGKIEV